MTTTTHTSPSGEDDANGAIGGREAHCVNTCNFYNKNRPCECPAPQSDATSWEALFDRVALELNCLPSSSVDGNGHVFEAIAKLRAALTAEKVAAEPVAIVRDNPDDIGTIIEATRPLEVGTQLYLATAPQPAQTQLALTDEQREAIAHLIARGSTFPDHNGSKGPVTRVDYARLQTAAKVLSALLAAHPESGGKS